MTGLVDELEALIPFLESHHCSAEPIRKAVARIEELEEALERVLDMFGAENYSRAEFAFAAISQTPSGDNK